MFIEYRGYKIWNNTKTVWEKNKISGHEYSRQIPIAGYYVAGRFASVSTTFKTHDQAKEYIDFLIRTMPIEA